ncbi:MAG: hypothetical protein OXI52_06575 [Caldilineaceae bacterium]|nr:hypothetical protein [Caldilineaceae bacterium]
MRQLRKELKGLRYEIQTMKGLLNALDRQLARVYGEKIRYAAPAPAVDEARLRADCGLDSSDLASPNMLRHLRSRQAARIREKQDRAAYLQHRLDTQLPISLWGFSFLLVKTLIKRHWPRSTRPQQPQWPQRPQHRHDRKRRLYKPREGF